MAEDFYKILGVSRSADQAAIQKSYRELARKHHPDLNPDDKSAKEKFQKIQRAYDVLNDPKKREMYDRFGPDFERVAEGAGAGWRPGGAGFGGGGPGGGASFEDFDFSQIFGGHPGGGFADIFSQFSGGAPRGARAAPGVRRGADVRHEVEIPFQTAVAGGEVQLTVRRPSGEVETITVKIPEGIEDGKKIRLRGQGEPAPRGQAGDLIVVVRVAPHPHFERKGRNLEVRVPVTLAEAAMGAKIDVPTPKGTITLTVPAGSSSGRRLRVKGYGVSPAGAPPGDLFAELQIVLPPVLDENDKELIRQLDQRRPMAPRAELTW